MECFTATARQLMQVQCTPLLFCCWKQFLLDARLGEFLNEKQSRPALLRWIVAGALCEVEVSPPGTPKCDEEGDCHQQVMNIGVYFRTHRRGNIAVYLIAFGSKTI
jgi:hypothetical protein